MPPTLDPTSDRAAYRQIADHLRTEIESGRLGQGSPLPSERQLMEGYGAARGTVRQAIALLRTEGLVDVSHGRGAFVRGRPQVKRLAYDRFARSHRQRGKAAFTAEAEAQGFTPSVEVIEIGRQEPPDWVADQLGLSDGEAVVVRRRRYLADGQPLQLATSYVPLAIAEGTQIEQPDTGPGGLYARLEDAGHRLTRFEEEVTARMPTPDEMRALRLPPGVPVLAVTRTAWTGTRAVEVCDAVMAADRFVLGYQLPAT